MEAYMCLDRSFVHFVKDSTHSISKLTNKAISHFSTEKVPVLIHFCEKPSLVYGNVKF